MKTRIVKTSKGIKVLFSKHHLRSELKPIGLILIFYLLIFLAFLPEIFKDAESSSLSKFSKDRLIDILGITNTSEYTKCYERKTNKQWFYERVKYQALIMRALSDIPYNKPSSANQIYAQE